MELLSIKTNKLCRNFGKTCAIESLSLNFESGIIHGIIGPDGSGKTTFLRMIAGLLHPDNGEINFYSDNSHVMFNDVRPYIAYMPSRASLYADLSIKEHLEFFKSLYQLDPEEYKKRKAKLLEITRLEKFENRKIGQLSGGMYKKTVLMCALLQSPLILLLDEPTNGVDPISRREFWELLYSLKEQNILILIATAYMDEAERCAKIHLLDSGKLIISGGPEEIKQREGIKSLDEIFLREAVNE